MDFVARYKKDQSNSSLQEKEEQEKITIVDICCGFGITSMFLSELLPPELVDKILLIDYNFPCHSESNPPHIQQIFYEREWPVQLRIRKVNIKKTREIRNLHSRMLNACPGPILMFGIHLCKALSVHAIKLYQNCPKAKLFVLKPCCLPGKDRQNVRRGEPILWKFINGYEFGPRDLYCKEINQPVTDDNVRGDEGANNNHDDEQETAIIESNDEETKQKGSIDSDDEKEKDYSDRPHGGRHCSSELFSRWIDLLERACQDDQLSIVKKEHTDITLHHFQNDFIYCERQGQ